MRLDRHLRLLQDGDGRVINAEEDVTDADGPREVRSPAMRHRNDAHGAVFARMQRHAYAARAPVSRVASSTRVAGSTSSRTVPLRGVPRRLIFYASASVPRHTSAYVRYALTLLLCGFWQEICVLSISSCSNFFRPYSFAHALHSCTIRRPQHTSAHVCIRQHTSAYVSILIF